MKSFLSIFSRNAKYSNAESILSEVGLDPETRVKTTILGSSKDFVFLTLGNQSDISTSTPCYIESEQYIIQYDIRVFKGQLGSADVMDLFDRKTIFQIFSNTYNGT